MLKARIFWNRSPASRFFSAKSPQNVTSYIDKWFETIVKPDTFYAKHSEGKIRRYFYNVDLQGRLFLEETLPKNIATSMKDEKFLNFFFSRIRRVRDVDKEFLAQEGVEGDYPFVALCGREVNFIRPAATPIVFHSLEGCKLHFGGNLTQPFQPVNLAISTETGRLYHQIVSSGRGVESSTTAEYGLIRSSVAVSLAERIHPGGDEETTTDLYFRTDNGVSPIESLPLGSEPGDWALPASIDD